MQLKISPGNSKLGKIPHVNLMPGATCMPGVPCRKDCYCQKALRMKRQKVYEAWQGNTDLYRSDPASYFVQLKDFLAKKSPKYFRFHSAGDIPDYEYLALMLHVAEQFPDTKFLCFTKRYDLSKSLSRIWIPRNFSMIVSMWPGLPRSAQLSGFRQAWMQDGTETRIPTGAVDCAGHCTGCYSCWDRQGPDVIFHKH